MTTDLTTAQQQFGRFLLNQDEPVPDSLAGDPEDVLRRLSVYRNNVYYSLTQALKDLYPVVSELVGSGFFRKTALEYLQCHPPQQAAMVFFGQDFPAFLRQSKLQQQLPYLAEVAQLELARHQAFHAADAPCLDAATLKSLGTQKLMNSRLRLHPSVRRLAGVTAFRSIWLAHRSDLVRLEAVQMESAEQALILRPETEVMVCRADPGLLDLLHRLEEGHSLAEALGEVGATHANFNASAALAFCFNQGVFCALQQE